MKDTETRREYRRHVSLLRPLKLKSAPNDDTALDTTPMLNDSGNAEDQTVHDVKELNDVCPNDESCTLPWSARLRKRRS